MKWRLLRGNTFTYEKIPPQEPPLHARSSSFFPFRSFTCLLFIVISWNIKRQFTQPAYSMFNTENTNRAHYMPSMILESVVKASNLSSKHD